MAPALILQSSYNLNEEAAQRIINMREKMPFYYLDTIQQVIGMNLDIDPYEFNFFPSNYLRLTLWYKGARRMRQVHLQFMPNAENRQPWQIEYTMELELLPVYSEKAPQHTKTSFFDATLSTKAQ
jgi:hypothetical protein